MSLDLLLPAGCCVCGVKDERQLTKTKLPSGAVATLCGSHRLMHERTGGLATSVAELRARLGERRLGRDRREGGDELGVALEQAFSPNRRGPERRRV